MPVVNEKIKLQTKEYLEFIDITEKIETFVSDNKLLNGIISIYSPHTTLAIRINEKESGIINDFKKLVEKIVPTNEYYEHNDLNIRTENLVCSVDATDCLNGHSHLIHLLLGASESVSVINGKLNLGVWQRIFAIELDSKRAREVNISFVGK